jgi:hypothetical protein
VEELFAVVVCVFEAGLLMDSVVGVVRRVRACRWGWGVADARLLSSARMTFVLNPGF